MAPARGEKPRRSAITGHASGTPPRRAVATRPRRRASGATTASVPGQPVPRHSCCIRRSTLEQYRLRPSGFYQGRRAQSWLEAISTACPRARHTTLTYGSPHGLLERSAMAMTIGRRQSTER